MKYAFSLIELSIVLVILGLLTGGILAGQSLIRAAELRGANSELSKFQSALHAFRDKYMALPGDMTNATTFWGTAGGDGLVTSIGCYSVPTTVTTCNGDGNGNIGATSGNSRNESWRAWQHLTNAALVEGAMVGTNGTYTGSSSTYIPGVSNPATKVGNVGYWQILNSNTQTATTQDFSFVRWGNHLALSAPSWSLLTPPEAWNIDTKLDDGMPGTGRVTSNKGNNTSTFCTSNAGSLTDTGATYRLDVASKDCALYFPNSI